MDSVFKFYLKKDTSTYYFYNNGAVGTTTVKTALKNAPIDWNEIQISSISNTETWVTKREFSDTMRFVFDGAKILRHVLVSTNYLSSVILVIEKLNTTTREYNLWYSSNIDFTQFEDDGDSFSVNLLEQDNLGLIINRGDVPYEISLDDFGIPLKLDGVKLGSSVSWIIGDATNGADGTPPYEHLIQSTNAIGQYLTDPSLHVFGLFVIPVTTQFSNNIQAGNFISPLDAEYNATVVSPLPNWNNLHQRAVAQKFSTAIINSTWYDVKIRCQFPVGLNIDVNGYGANDLKFKILVWFKTGRWINGNYYHSATYFLGESGDINHKEWVYPYIDVSATIPQIGSGNTAVLYYTIVYSPNSPTIPIAQSPFATVKIQQFTEESLFRIRYNAKVNPSYCRAIRYKDYLRQLVGKVTGNYWAVESEFLSKSIYSAVDRFNNFDSHPYNVVLTSGDGLRGMPKAVIKSTFNATMKDLWARYMVTWGMFFNIVKIEPLSYFLQDTELLKIDSIKGLKITLFKDRLFNQVSVGYEAKDNDLVDGKNEFNTTMTFLSEANTQSKASDDAIAPYRSDVYGIESVRAKTYDEQTKDNKFDNDVYAIEIGDTQEYGYYRVLKHDPNTIDGVDDPSNMYNITLSPKRALLRHLRRLRSMVNVGLLKYQSTDRNPELESNLWSGFIKESADIDLSLEQFFFHDMSIMFKPFVIEFECAPPYNLSEMLSLGSNGYVSFKYKGNWFKGFILDVGCTPATRDKYQFRLLCHKENNLSLLMNM